MNSNERVATGTFSVGCNTGCGLGEAGLLPPNDRSASPLRNINCIRLWSSTITVGSGNCCRYTLSVEEARGRYNSPNPPVSHPPENCSPKGKRYTYQYYRVH